MILTNYYSTKLYKVAFPPVFYASHLLFRQNYVATLLGVPKKSESSLIYPVIYSVKVYLKTFYVFGKLQHTVSKKNNTSGFSSLVQSKI